VRVVVLVTDQNSLTRPAHAMLLVVFLEALQARKHRRILFWLTVLGTECIVAERVEAYRLWLVAVEILGECGPAIQVRVIVYL